MTGTSIAENLKSVRSRMASACSRAGRPASDVRLIAVSKRHAAERVSEALAAGQTAFGENYVQELVEKSAALEAAEWHFIGSLQTNKSRLVVGRAQLIHSVDRLKLASELSRAAVAAGLTQDVLVQVLIGDEASKHGVAFDTAEALIDDVRELPGLRLRGVMSLPPLSEDERVARGYFAQLRAGFEKWRGAEFNELSMGTSSDFEWAILEGATMVRVGTAIFGARG